MILWQVLYTTGLASGGMLARREVQVRRSKTWQSFLLIHSLPRAQKESLSSPKLAVNRSQIGWCLVFYKILSYLEREVPTCKLLTVCPFVWMSFYMLSKNNRSNQVTRVGFVKWNRKIQGRAVIVVQYAVYVGVHTCSSFYHIITFSVCLNRNSLSARNHASVCTMWAACFL